MSWDEWEQLKANAATRDSPRTQLNHAVPDGGGGYCGVDPDLKSDKKAWSRAGGDVSALKGDIGKALTKLEEGQAGLGDTAGCQSAAAQSELFDSWKKYVGKVSGRCGELGGLMERSGQHLSMTDSDMKGELDKIRLEYRDTEPVGGQAKDK